jgi:hypothetical protein
MRLLRRKLAIAASIAALITVSLAAPAAPAEATSGPTIVYSETYLRYIALFPLGWATNRCELGLALQGGTGVCEATIAPVYFYPDGSLGEKPWVVDPSSPTGWSVPNPCEGVADLDWETWAAYVDGTNYPGWVDVPPLTDEQVECGVWAYGWWL